MGRCDFVLMAHSFRSGLIPDSPGPAFPGRVRSHEPAGRWARTGQKGCRSSPAPGRTVHAGPRRRRHVGAWLVAARGSDDGATGDPPVAEPAVEIGCFVERERGDLG